VCSRDRAGQLWGRPSVALKAILGGAAYAIFNAHHAAGEFSRGFGSATEKAGQITPALLAMTLMLVMLGAWVTDAIGLHAVFGGFSWEWPAPRFIHARLKRQLEPFAVVFLLRCSSLYRTQHSS